MFKYLLFYEIFKLILFDVVNSLRINFNIFISGGQVCTSVCIQLYIIREL